MAERGELDPLLTGKTATVYGNPPTIKHDEENQTYNKFKAFAFGDNRASIESTKSALRPMPEKDGKTKAGPQRYLYYVIYALV